VARAPLFTPCEALGYPTEAGLEFEPRGVQGWTPLLREGTADRGTVSTHHLGFRPTPAGEAPFDGTYPAATLLEFFLGMPLSVVKGLGGLAEVGAVTELGRHLGAHVGAAARERAVRNDTDERNWQSLAHCSQPACQLLLSRG
jgi:hypothetical protein